MAPALHSAISTRIKMHASLLGVQVAFASLSIVGKDALATFEPSELVFFRMLGAAAVLWVLHGVKLGSPLVPMRDAATIFALSLLGMVANQLLFLFGLERTTPVTATLLTCTIPVFALLIAVALRHEALRWRNVLGVGVAVLGVVLLLGTEGMSFGPSAVIGDAMILCNAACYAAYLVLMRAMVLKHGHMKVMTLACTFGAVAIAPVCTPNLLQHSVHAGARAWALVAFLVLVPTLFAYLLNAWALRRAPASLVATYVYAQPVAAMLFTFVLGREAPSAWSAFAAMVVLGGIAFATFADNARPELACERNGVPRVP